MHSTLWTAICSRCHTTYSYSYSLCIAYYTLYYLFWLTSGVSLCVSLPSSLDRRLSFLVQIHDSDMITGHIFEKAINGPAHHTLHHLYFTVNYGQVSAPLLIFSVGDL